MSAYVRCAAALAALTATLAFAGGPTVYESEENDTFQTAQTIFLSDSVIYLDGKLGERLYRDARPDTYIGAFDKLERVIAQDDNSSSLGNGKASALYGLEPVPDGDGGNSTIRLWITGRPDGFDGNFNGLFFNGPHRQIGEFTLHITYYIDHAIPPRSDTYTEQDTRVLRFETGAESFRINLFPPQDTTSVDIVIDNTTGTQPVLDDVDHYLIEGLEPLCDYAITAVAGVDVNTCLPSDTVLGWFDKNGNLINTDSNSGPIPQYPQLSVLTDANGRLRIAVSGRGDLNFNGLVDFLEGSRTIDTPIPDPPKTHRVHGCYTLLFDHIIHQPDNLPTTDREMMLHGDLNTDGTVNVIDLAIMLNNFGWSAP